MPSLRGPVVGRPPHVRDVRQRHGLLQLVRDVLAGDRGAVRRRGGARGESRVSQKGGVRRVRVIRLGLRRGPGHAGRARRLGCQVPVADHAVRRPLLEYVAGRAVVVRGQSAVEAVSVHATDREVAVNLHS